MENSGVGDDDDREVLVWDCGSPLYDSYEIASVGHLIERHTMSLPSSPLLSRWINPPPGASSVVGVSNRRRTLVSSKSGISGYCKEGVVKQCRVFWMSCFGFDFRKVKVNVFRKVSL
ncbi:hypothetical protein LINPERPRIM_LOCUS24552 [Linum perenne]